MNRVEILGRIVKDPDVRYSQGDKPMAVARFTVACDRKFKKQGEQTADFINCIAFSKTAEVIEKYFHKGMRIALDGRIQTGSYTNKDGKKVYTTDIVAESVEFCESKSESQQNNAQNSPAPMPDADGFMNIPDNIDDSELPFA